MPIPRARVGLTIIELLVVVAVLCLLAAMLFPIFSGARAASCQTVCKNNLRQLGTAFAMYSEDFGGYWPCPGGLVGDRGYWSQSSRGGIQRYVRQRGLKSVWCCPLLDQWQGKYPARSYCMNSYLRDPPDAEYPTCVGIVRGVDTYRITQRHRTILLFEGVPLSGGWQDQAYSEDQIYYIYRCANWTWARGYYNKINHTIDPGHPWHGRVNNYLFTDCHIAARPPARYAGKLESTYEEMYQWYVDKAAFRRRYLRQVR